MRMFKNYEVWRGDRVDTDEGDIRVDFMDHGAPDLQLYIDEDELERTEFLIYCFSLVRPWTLDHIIWQLAPYLSRQTKDKKVILLAFDRDRTDPNKRSQWKPRMREIPREAIDKSIQDLDAYAYIEWDSSDDEKSYEQLRDTVMRIHETGKKEIQSGSKIAFPFGCEVA